MTIRLATLSDIKKLTTLFRETILEVNAKDYTLEQLKIWSSVADNDEMWQQRIMNQYFAVSEEDDNITGMASITYTGYLDFMYVHKDFQRRGIAQKLYLFLEEQARWQQNETITSEVSITARPFFEKMGFKIITAQVIERQGISFTNYKMAKQLARADAVT